MITSKNLESYYNFFETIIELWLNPHLQQGLPGESNTDKAAKQFQPWTHFHSHKTF